MNTREIAAEYRLKHWAQAMRERAEQGLSVRAYCESRGIHENTYFYWQRKLREAACVGLPAAEPAPSEQSLAPKGWAALSVGDQLHQPRGLSVDVGGCRINVRADTDAELLAKVCRVLKAL